MLKRDYLIKFRFEQPSLLMGLYFQVLGFGSFERNNIFIWDLDKLDELNEEQIVILYEFLINFRQI